MIKKTQQEWAKDVIFYILKNIKDYNANDLKSQGYRYGINGMIDNYSLIYLNKSTMKNVPLYHNYYNNFKNSNYKKILFSEEAYNILSNTTEKIDDKEFHLHGEHLTPMSYTINYLNKILEETKNSKKKLSDSEIKEKIDFAFSHAKLCIITERERRDYLDKAGLKYLEEEIDEFINEYKIIRTMNSDYFNAYNNLVDKYKRSNGFGAIRLWSLKKNNVNFVNFNGNKQEFEDCIKYLEDDDYTI